MAGSDAVVSLATTARPRLVINGNLKLPSGTKKGLAAAKVRLPYIFAKKHPHATICRLLGPLVEI